jgi:putative holliday junction resolvase
MKHLGIDFGTKKIGIALSDDGGTIAFPKQTIISNHDAIKVITELCVAEGVQKIVIGKSLDQAGKSNPIQANIETFAQKLEIASNLPVVFQNELYSSFESDNQFDFGGLSRRNQENQKGKRPQIKDDAKAAAVILQRYLDAHK